MSEEDNRYKPFQIEGDYLEAPSSSPLTKPFLLKATYLGQPPEQDIVQYLNVFGFLPTEFGQTTVFKTQFLNPSGFNAIQLGNTKAELKKRFVNPGSFKTDVYGQTTIINKNKFIYFGGLIATGYGKPSIKNLTDQLFPLGIAISAYGRPTIYNLRQYIYNGGLYSAVFGTAYMQGGVKFVNTYGLDALAFPTPRAINTRADQNAQVFGISIPDQQVSNPNVSPRHIRPAGIIAWSFGIAWVQRNPSPKGFTNDSYGTAWVSHSPRYLSPDWIQGFQAGYPKAFDPTQKIRHEGSPHIPGGIFGDIGIKNARRVLSVRGEDQSRYGIWTNLYSNLTKVATQSFDAKAFGSVTIWNKTPSVIPKSWGITAFGTTFVSDRVRRILGRGIEMAESQRFGIHTLSKPPEIKPGAVNTLSFGDTWVSNKRRNLTPSGFNSLQFNGAPIVWFRYRYVGATGVNFSIVAAPKIEHGLRNLVANGSSFNVFGTPIVWFKVRSIRVPSVYREFETNHLVGGTQHIRPSGYVASEFGKRIVPENQSIYGLGFSSQGFRETNRIELHTRWVRATGFLTFGQQTSERYGTAKIWNKRQYVNHNYDSGDGLNPGGFGQWNAIANRNREMKVSGFDASKHSYNQIDNKARPILPLSFVSTAFGKAMIAERVRRLRLEGMEAPYMSGWGRIFNAAHQMLVSGRKHDLYGQPSVINTRREYRWVGAFESLVFGQPMVAFRIRKLNIESRYSINPIYMPLPKVELRTRYIDPQGPDLQAFGGPSLYIKWNIITTRWSHHDLFGDQNIWNLTPELKQRGVNSEEFGKPAIRLQWEKYTVEGFGNQIFGRLNIAYRNRSMTVTGFNAFGIGQVKVTKTGAPPYSLQNITLDWSGEGERPESYSGYGIEPPRVQVSSPSLKTNVIFASGFVATAFGSHHTQSNGILVQPGIQQFAIGNHTVGLKNRTINVPTLGDFSDIANTRPRLSPHTIYAVTEAPEQAIRNNPPSGTLHFVNSDWGSRAPGEVFGWVNVSLRHRGLILGAGYQSYFGQPSVILKKNYIRPTGIQSFRMGWHSFLDGSPRELVQFDSTNNALYGQPTVVSPYYGQQTIWPVGMNVTVFGSNRIEFFNRTVRANGFNALLMGAGRSGDTPYKPQGLWIGPQMPTIPKGFASELFGTTWISNKVRDISAVGFDSMENDWDISSFKERMKVTLVKKPVVIEPKEIQPLSFGKTAYGVPNICLKTHYIRPDGNSDQYRKGGPK